MYQIKADLPVNGEHWGLEFQNGIAWTDNKPLAERLAERGYGVKELDAAEETPSQPKLQAKRKKEG